MRVETGFVVLAATLGAIKLWTSGATSTWLSTGVLVGAGLCALVVALVVGLCLRNRQRRRLMDMQGSALW